MWAGLTLGLMLFAMGAIAVAGGDFPWRGTLVLSWTGWLEMALGVAICAVTLRDAERRAKAKLREDAAKKAAEADDAGAKSSADSAAIPPQVPGDLAQADPDKDSPHTS